MQAIDLGGNRVPVTLFGISTNLHRVWDVALIERGDPKLDDLTRHVAAMLTPALQQRWEAGTPEQWAIESDQVAIETAYNLPASHEIELGNLDKALPVIHDQLAKAAVRLGLVLNQALGIR